MLDERGYIQTKRNKEELISAAANLDLRQIEIMSDQELASIPTGSIFVFDVECYPNFFFVAFKHLNSGKYVTFEQSSTNYVDFDKLLWLMWRFCLVGFNSRDYDIPLISLLINGASCKKLKEASNFIVSEKVNFWGFERAYNIEIQKYNHIDLIEVAPLQGSLKLYAGRLHCKRMQDLPFDPERCLSENEAEITRLYCCNDLDNTQLLFEGLAPEINLRNEMSKQYEIDLRSKSDAQIAEAVINNELSKILGFYPKKPKLDKDTILAYNVPDFVSFNSPALNNVLETVRNARFSLDAGGAPVMPVSLEKLIVSVGKSDYKLGMGGLHSQETKVAHLADENTIIADNDVASFYPRIILNQRLFPPHLGEPFLEVYENIVNTRINAKRAAKDAKDKKSKEHWKTIADSLKITINGSFGKLGNKYSTLYSPQLLLQVTLTGQLVLLMLIEMLESARIDIVSGNTDGIIAKYPVSRHNDVRAIIKAWEDRTCFETEETQYRAVYSRDVNSYVAIKKDGGDSQSKYLDERLGCKTKGFFSERGSALNSILSKNPEVLICSDAVLNFLVTKKPVEETIKECTDIRRFVSVRNVKGGAEKNGLYLGKVVRFYYPRGEVGYISYVLTGNKVPKTDGARPLMDLPNELPNDINYNYYIEVANDMLYSLSALKKPSAVEFNFD